MVHAVVSVGYLVILNRNVRGEVWHRRLAALGVLLLLGPVSCFRSSPYRIEEAEFHRSPAYWIVGERQQFIVAIAYSRRASGGTGDGPPFTFEAGARLFLCDVGRRTSTLLCNAPFPEQRFFVRTVSVSGWDSRSLYIRLDAYGDLGGPKTVQYRIAIDGGCEIVDGPLPEMKSSKSWNSQGYVFIDRDPARSGSPALLSVRGRNAGGGLTEILVTAKDSGEPEVMFGIPAGSAEVVPTSR